MTSRLLSVLVCFAVIACTAQADPTTTSTDPTTTTTTTAPTTTSTTSPPTTSTTIDPGPILGLITTTGVPVAIAGIDGGYWIVESPCGEMVALSDGEPLYRTTVILDPGHGGSTDPGAVGRNGLPEQEVNLKVAQEAQRLLEARGIDTVLTRTDNYSLRLPVRARFADALQATIMVSIHHNAPTPAPSPIPGNEVFIQTDSDESRRLGGLLYEYSVAALTQFDIPWTAAPDAGVMTVRSPRGVDTYGILRLPSTPTALLEFGYMSHPVEAELFATEEYVKVAGESVADAVEAYLTTDQPGSGWQPGRNFTAQPGLGASNCIDPDLGEEG